MSAAQLFVLPETREERQMWNFRRTAREILAGNSPVTMEVPDLSPIDVAATREGLWQLIAEFSAEELKRWNIFVERDRKFIEPDDGLIAKDGVDWKKFFHYRPGLKDLLRVLKGVEVTPAQAAWFDHMERIWNVCTAAHIAYAEQLDLLRPGFNFAERARRFAHSNVLRTLWYVPRAGTLAQWHSDRCATTFHMAESAEGLKVASGWDIVPQRSPEPPEVLVFTGDQFAKLTRNAIPARHHVVDDSTGGTKERFAMVFFGKMDG